MDILAFTQFGLKIIIIIIYLYTFSNGKTTYICIISMLRVLKTDQTELKM